MRLIESSSAFKRDFKRESKGRYKKTLELTFVGVIQKLANDIALEPQYKNHPLIGEWSEFWECHIKPDLLLIYKKVDIDRLLLARIGSHSELFR
ncbi:MAG: type II toxin-antitoxin system YafQ family toxin [Burkholderiales bacterium]